MKTPKEKLKEIYDEYLEWLNNYKNEEKEPSFYYFISLNQKWLLSRINQNNLLSQICGFSTTSECRKAINELENTNPENYVYYGNHQSSLGGKQETWQDILDEWVNNGMEEDDYAINFLNYLKDNFEVPKRK